MRSGVGGWSSSNKEAGLSGERHIMGVKGWGLVSEYRKSGECGEG